MNIYMSAECRTIIELFQQRNGDDGVISGVPEESHTTNNATRGSCLDVYVQCIPYSIVREGDAGFEIREEKGIHVMPSPLLPFISSHSLSLTSVICSLFYFSPTVTIHSTLFPGPHYIRIDCH